MANFSGAELPMRALTPGTITAPGQCSPQVSGFANVFAPLTAMRSLGAIVDTQGETPAAGMGVTTEAPTALDTDQESAMHGAACLWEKVIVTPRTKACGFVLADVTWDTNVWNTHLRTIATLQRIDVLDSGNVRVNNPLGFPLAFGPLQSRNFATVVPQDGDATIQALVTFVFPGESGATMVITGSRITVFGFEADWSEKPTERTQWLTDVLTAYNGTEQRAALRSVPRTQFGFRVSTQTRLESAALDALIFGWQSRIFGVPFWPDAQPIKQAANAGDTVLYADTRYRKFAPGGIAVLWRDLFTSEAVTILGVSDDSITTTAPINASFAADGLTYLIPAMAGRMSDPHVRRLNNGIAEVDLLFQIEVC